MQELQGLPFLQFLGPVLIHLGQFSFVFGAWAEFPKQRTSEHCSPQFFGCVFLLSCFHQGTAHCPHVNSTSLEHPWQGGSVNIPPMKFSCPKTCQGPSQETIRVPGAVHPFSFLGGVVRVACPKDQFMCIGAQPETRAIVNNQVLQFSHILLSVSLFLRC